MGDAGFAHINTGFGEGAMALHELLILGKLTDPPQRSTDVKMRKLTACVDKP